MGTEVEVFKRDIAFTDDFILTPTGDLDVLEGLANMREALFRRLITVKGSIVHRPNYGIGIGRFQNSINSVSNQTELATIIKEQFELDPRVKKVTGVSFNSEVTTPEKVVVRVKVDLAGYNEVTFEYIPFGEGL